MINIKVISGWCDVHENTTRLLRQFCTSDADVDGINFVFDESYDVLVVLGYVSQSIIKPNTPILVFPHEPTWSGGHQKNFHIYENIKVFGFDSFNYDIKDNIIETIAHMVYGGCGPWQEGYDNWSYNNIISNKFYKTKNISSFVTARGKGENLHTTCTYTNRVNLINNLIDSSPYVDFYGGHPVDKNKPQIKNFASNKYEGIKDYKFCLAIENSHENYYISEKFYDCILTNTIPIYFGCKNIEQFWPENGYILLDNITDFNYVTKVIENIHSNIDNLYTQMLPAVTAMKDRYFRDFNLLKKIKLEVNNLN